MLKRAALVLDDQSYHVGRYVGRRRGGHRGDRCPGALAIVVDDRGIARVAHARFLFSLWVEDSCGA